MCHKVGNLLSTRVYLSELHLGQKQCEIGWRKGFDESYQCGKDSISQKGEDLLSFTIPDLLKVGLQSLCQATILMDSHCDPKAWCT